MRRTRTSRPFAALRTAMLAMAVVTVIPSLGLAAEIEDVPFPDAVDAGEAELPLFGLGLLRYRVLFRGYVGGLYLPRETRSRDTLSDIPKALELHYFWDIKGNLFGEAAEKLLARTQSPAKIESLRGRLDKLNRLYRDVAPGDRYRLTYVPGEGTTLAYNGQPLGTIPGADFAEAYFGIWLGEEPLNEAFRDQMFAGTR